MSERMSDERLAELEATDLSETHVIAALVADEATTALRAEREYAATLEAQNAALVEAAEEGVVYQRALTLACQEVRSISSIGRSAENWAEMYRAAARRDLRAAIEGSKP